MSDPAIIEAAARALQNGTHAVYSYDNALEFARIMLKAVRPLIRAAALEEAAQRIEADEEDYLMRMYVAAAIRTLKEQP